MTDSVKLDADGNRLLHATGSEHISDASSDCCCDVGCYYEAVDCVDPDGFNIYAVECEQLEAHENGGIGLSFTVLGRCYWVSTARPQWQTEPPASRIIDLDVVEIFPLCVCQQPILCDPPTPDYCEPPGCPGSYLIRAEGFTVTTTGETGQCDFGTSMGEDVFYRNVGGPFNNCEWWPTDNNQPDGNFVNAITIAGTSECTLIAGVDHPGDNNVRVRSNLWIFPIQCFTIGFTTTRWETQSFFQVILEEVDENGTPNGDAVGVSSERLDVMNDITGGWDCPYPWERLIDETRQVVFQDAGITFTVHYEGALRVF